jgi:solute:Na+ symporter, SSS family
VLMYILVGGLTGAVYNEVLQFFVILAGLIPLTVVAVAVVGGPQEMMERLSHYPEYWTHPWSGTAISPETAEPNPIGNWVGIVLGQAFILSFGYWTTNFAEVQRAMSARNLNSARRAPIIGAFPKIFIPFIVLVPGIVAALIIPGLGTEEALAENPNLTYTNAIPILMGELLPTGVLGVAVTGLVAAFMAGMAANVSSFNTVMTYDIVQGYIAKNKPDSFYLNFGRIITIVGVFIGIATAFIAAQYNNINEYLQTLFSFFQAPVFVTFILGMFWRRTSAQGGFWGLISGTAAAGFVWIYSLVNPDFFRSSFEQAMWMGIVAAAVDLWVTVIVTRFTAPKPESELVGLVKGLEIRDVSDVGEVSWYRSPAFLGTFAIVLAMSMYGLFLFF